MSRHRTSILATAILSAALWASACGDGTTEPPPPDPPRPTTVTVTPATAELTALDATVQLNAQVLDQYGQVMAAAAVTWSSGDASVAAVDGAGLVTAAANGAATITATAGSASGTAMVTVAQKVSSVEVSPAAATVVERDTVRFVAKALDANGHSVAAAEFAWSSSDTSVAVVDGAGLVSGVGAGEVEVTAASSGVAGSAALVVEAPVPTTVTVAPDTLEFAALADTVRLMAEVRDQIGRVMEGEVFAWASGDTMVAVVDSAGLVGAVGNGVVTVTATAGEASGTAVVTVAQKVGAVEVSPAVDTVVLGDTARFEAAALDANGHAVAAAEFAWSSSDTAVAVVDGAGLVSGVGAGEVEVTAMAAGVVGSAQITVVAPAPTTVVVAPDTVSFMALGRTVQLAAEVRDQEGRVMEGVPVAWSSADPTVAAVDSAGLVTAVGTGAAAVTATAGSASGEAVVTVMQSAGSVVVSPAADTVALGDTLRLEAEAFDANGHRVEGARFDWSSSDVAVARVDGSGLVTGVAEGAATITATAGAARGTAGITVQNPDRAALVALYNATDGPNWAKSENWLTDAPLRNWYGVDTDADGRVVRLDLRKSPWAPQGLWGPIPPEIGNLTHLTTLDLSGNIGLSGPIPPEFGNLTNLTEFSFNWTELTSLPSTVGRLARLERLEAQKSRLTGPIPPELGNLANLATLDLQRNRLSGPIPPELGNLTRLARLDLWLNHLSGPIPAELGNLVNLKHLVLAENNLTGPIPHSFVQLDQLSVFVIRGRREFEQNDLCVPGTSTFVAWLGGIETTDGSESYCNAVDGAALELLFETAGGTEWTESAGWLDDGALEEQHGVAVDSLGRVTELDLAGNGLEGQLPATLGDLTRMTVLRIGDNALSGRLPLSLVRVPLQTLDYANTELCTPVDGPFQVWLDAIPSHEGTGVECAPLSDREILKIFYQATGGANWTNSDNWLTDASLQDWYGVTASSGNRVTRVTLYGNALSGSIPPELGGLANLTDLQLFFNGLAGPIPAELGNLVNLTWLDLGGNQLSGPIPSELGNLANLTVLDLHANQLSGPIPSELGNLASLTGLYLPRNDLIGPIPAELGNLARLTDLYLQGNNLAGSIPAELGNLTRLRDLYLQKNNLAGSIPTELGNLGSAERLDLGENALTGALPPRLGNLSILEELDLSDNMLTGPVPHGLGAMASLQQLSLTNNAGMSGPLPADMTTLHRLDALLAGGTRLCTPPDPGFRAWLKGVHKRRIVVCGAGNPPAYLSQAVQSREFPVPLVAGRRALLRVFVTAGTTTAEGIPLVRARFYRDGREIHVENIPGKSDPIPLEVDEGSLSKSANAEIPGHVVQPGLEVVIEVDPDGTLDPALGVVERIPETGRLALDVRAMPLFDLTLIPFIWAETNDSSIVELAEAMAADPENHEMLEGTRTLLPVGDLNVAAHEPVLSSSNNAFDLFANVRAIRAMEGGTGHFMGMMTEPVNGASGFAVVGGRYSFVAVSATGLAPITHELGHNMSLFHAPCGTPNPDPSYPYPDGSLGNWGYDFGDGGRLVPPFHKDVMGYCQPSWISDYHFTTALRYRLAAEGTHEAAVAARSSQSLLLWGGVGADSVPFLEPAFVVDARPELPRAGGEHRLTGRTGDGEALFSLSFTMPVVADGDGSSSFAFVLPVESGWAGALATITLSGPGGSATLDADTDLAMAILRNPRTGQVRGILRDMPDPGAAVALAAGPGLEVLLSRGIPGAAAWWR